MTHATIAVCTAIYPGVEKYLPAWHHSVCRQTDRNFDLWIGLDSLGIDEACRAIGAAPNASWVRAGSGTTPATLRQLLMSLLLHRYRQIVFVDSDDLLAPTRVEAARAALADCDVNACALRIGDANGCDLGLMFGPARTDDLRALLPRYNVFGLSNSAYRTSILERCLPLPPACELIDWLLATRALVSGATLRFDPVPRMIYRQHTRNAAHVLHPFTPQRVLEATGRVARHFRLLLDSHWEWPSGTRAPFLEQQARVEQFFSVMRRSPQRLQAYVDALNGIPPRYVWWWSVAHPDLEELWNRSH